MVWVLYKVVQWCTVATVGTRFSKSNIKKNYWVHVPYLFWKFTFKSFKMFLTQKAKKKLIG